MSRDNNDYYYNSCRIRRDHDCPCNDEENENNEINNLMLSLVEAVGNNSNAISNLLVQIQANIQYQRSTDTSSLQGIGNNEVNVVGFIDPDTTSGAEANNESDVTATGTAASNAISESLTALIKQIITQVGLVNDSEQ